MSASEQAAFVRDGADGFAATLEAGEFWTFVWNEP
jgi:hypothetical protein